MELKRRKYLAYTAGSFSPSVVEGKYLAHYGTDDMRWGRQRYQINGKWTEEGLRRRREREALYRSQQMDREAAARVAKENEEARKKIIEENDRIIRTKMAEAEAAKKKAEEAEAASKKAEEESAAKKKEQEAEKAKNDAAKAQREADLAAKKLKLEERKAEQEEMKNRIEVMKSVSSGIKSAAPVVPGPMRSKDAKENAINRAIAYERAHQYTDQDLRDIISRIRLENDYVNLTSPDQHRREQKAKEIIEGLSSVAGLVTAGALLVAAVKKARGSDDD